MTDVRDIMAKVLDDMTLEEMRRRAVPPDYAITYVI